MNAVAVAAKNIIQLRLYGRYVEKRDLFEVCGYSSSEGIRKEIQNLEELNSCFKWWYSEYKKPGVRRVPKTLAIFFIKHIMGEETEVDFSRNEINSSKKN